MSDRWEERKEQLATFRTEYGHLFTDLHFFQGLRFAVLGATLPVAAGLFTYYRAALPFVKATVSASNPSIPEDPFTAFMVAALGVVLFPAVYSIELGIRNQTAALIVRGAEIEEMLGIQRGAFTTLKNRVRVHVILRISGIISIGSGLGVIWAFYLLVRTIWDPFH